MVERCAIAGVLLPALLGAWLPVASAQDSRNNSGATGVTANPPGLFFVLKTKSGGRSFHLGEMVEIEEDYWTLLPEQYLLLQNAPKLKGGAAPSLKIVPGEGVIDRLRETGLVSAQAILHARCAGGTLGAGSGGGCGDCDGTYKLGIEPVHFPYFLNYRFAITKPGPYTIQAHAANIVAVGDRGKPIPVTSTPLQIEIVRDDAWSHEELQSAVWRFEAAQRQYTQNGWGKRDPQEEQLPQQTETALKMENAAETIRFLGTEESLQEAVRLYDGSPRVATYGNPFLKAILESSYRDEAVRLLAKRMLEEDFLASEDFIDLLTAMTSQVEEPILFDRTDAASREELNPRTLDILRDYVLALGKSLPSKNIEARTEGMATFEKYAAKDYCTTQPLVEKRVADQILAKAKSQFGAR